MGRFSINITSIRTSLNYVFTLAFHHQRQPQKLGPNKPSKLLASKSITTTTTNKYKFTTSTTNTIAMSREFLENHSRVMAGTTLTVAVRFPSSFPNFNRIRQIWGPFQQPFYRVFLLLVPPQKVPSGSK